MDDPVPSPVSLDHFADYLNNLIYSKFVTSVLVYSAFLFFFFIIITIKLWSEIIQIDSGKLELAFHVFSKSTLATVALADESYDHDFFNC